MLPYGAASELADGCLRRFLPLGLGLLYYNVEPYYKSYRDCTPIELCANAGFNRSRYFQFVVPSIGSAGLAAVDEAIRAESGTVSSETTGRLAAGIQWFGYGAWRENVA